MQISLLFPDAVSFSCIMITLPEICTHSLIHYANYLKTFTVLIL